jgi:hypothetical protein
MEESKPIRLSRTVWGCSSSESVELKYRNFCFSQKRGEDGLYRAFLRRDCKKRDDVEVELYKKLTIRGVASKMKEFDYGFFGNLAKLAESMWSPVPVAEITSTDGGDTEFRILVKYRMFGGARIDAEVSGPCSGEKKGDYYNVLEALMSVEGPEEYAAIEDLFSEFFRMPKKRRSS